MYVHQEVQTFPLNWTFGKVEPTMDVTGCRFIFQSLLSKFTKNLNQKCAIHSKLYVFISPKCVRCRKVLTTGTVQNTSSHVLIPMHD